jgi:hypothetical protein
MCCVGDPFVDQPQNLMAMFAAISERQGGTPEIHSVHADSLHQTHPDSLSRSGPEETLARPQMAYY